MLARRRLQADDTIPVVGVTAYPLPDPDDPAAAGDELVSTEVVDEVTDNLEVDEQVTGEMHGYRRPRTESTPPRRCCRVPCICNQ